MRWNPRTSRLCFRQPLHTIPARHAPSRRPGRVMNSGPRPSQTHLAIRRAKKDDHQPGGPLMRRKPGAHAHRCGHRCGHSYRCSHRTTQVGSCGGKRRTRSTRTFAETQASTPIFASTHGTGPDPEPASPSPYADSSRCCQCRRGRRSCLYRTTSRRSAHATVRTGVCGVSVDGTIPQPHFL